ncbi:MAG: M48 family metallopeptidase [Candidatus Brocadiales bacterium]
MNTTKRTSSKSLSIIIVTIASLIFPLGCMGVSTGPQVTQEEVRRETQELEVKKQQYEVKKQKRPFAGLDLARQRKLVKTVGSELLRQVEDSLDVNFQVQEGEAVNAGATFGKIVVTTGMIRFLGSKDELAVVLGHELAHLTKGHLTKGIVSNIPVIIGSTVAESISPGSGEVVQKGGSIFTQKFSRDMEREADHFGIHYAHNAGYDAAAGIDIWERFAIELPVSQKTTIFSSHPSSTERMVRARKVANSLKAHSK